MRRKPRLPCRSQDWMAALQRATVKPASVFIFIFAVTNFTVANELELMATYNRFPGKFSRKSTGCVDRTLTHKHICAAQSVHKRGTHHTHFAQELHNIFVRLKRICHLVRTCLTLCCSLNCRSPRAPHLPHSLFLHHDTRTSSTIATTPCTLRTLSTTLI